MDGLRTAREAGKIGHIAISGHQQEGLLRAIDSGEFDVVMVAVNLFDQEVIREVLPPAKEQQVGTIATGVGRGSPVGDFINVETLRGELGNQPGIHRHRGVQRRLLRP